MQTNQCLEALLLLQDVWKCLGLTSIQFDRGISVIVCLLHCSIFLWCAILSATFVFPDSLSSFIAFSWLRSRRVSYVRNNKTVTKQYYVHTQTSFLKLVKAYSVEGISSTLMCFCFCSKFHCPPVCLRNKLLPDHQRFDFYCGLSHIRGKQLELSLAVRQPSIFLGALDRCKVASKFAQPFFRAVDLSLSQ